MSKGVKDETLAIAGNQAHTQNRVNTMVPVITKGVSNNAQQNQRALNTREDAKQNQEDTGRRNYVKQRTNANNQAAANNYINDNNYGFGPVGSSTNNDDENDDQYQSNAVRDRSNNGGQGVNLSNYSY